jgi:hypothetical protein
MECEVNGFIMDHVLLSKNVQPKVDEQIEKFKKLGYNDDDISVIRYVDIAEISEKSVSFYDSVNVCIPYGKVKIEDINHQGKKIRYVLKWVSTDRNKAFNEEGVRISEALELELKAIQDLKKLAEKWC